MLGLGIAAGLGSTALNMRELGRRRPRLDSSSRAIKRLDQGFEERIDQIAPGQSKYKHYNIDFNAPSRDVSNLQHLNDLRNNSLQYAGSTSPYQEPGIKINPNADRIYLAHEMGHLASQATDVGRFVATLRANPKLSTALKGALLTAPGIAAAVQAGDEDMDESLALAAAASLPTLIDEGLATKNGLAIAENAGLRASLGQRGKLAGAFLSYLAPVLIAGAGGNALGNLIDQDI